MQPRRFPFKSMQGFPDCACLCTEIKARHEALYLVQLEKLNEMVAARASLRPYTLAGLYCDLSGPCWKHVRRLAGSIYAHELYFSSFRRKNEPKGRAADAVKDCFGDLECFWDEVERIADATDAPGFLWLLLRRDHTLALERTLLFNRPCEKDGCPLLAIDLWEHAWLPQYDSAQAYARAMRECLDWKFVEERYLRCCCRL